MKNKIQIVFTGAQGTGKTTLVNELSKKFNIKALSIARDTAVSTGWTASTPGTVEYQKELFDKLYKALSSKKGFVSDRSLSCVAGYTFNHALANMDDKKFKKLADTQYKKFCKFHNEHPDVLIVYTPIEFDLLEDGLRSTNKELQQGLDFIIKNILDVSNANYLTVTGTVEERMEQIVTELQNRALI
jgi:deoxyadenosine/deoxycytidine kinase